MYKKYNVKYLFIAITILLIVFALIYSILYKNKKSVNISNFEQCKSAGYQVMESYPEKCKISDGRVFTNFINQQDIDVRGEYTCLPQKNKKGPQTLECALGIKEQGQYEAYYGLIDKESKYVSGIATGSNIVVKGKIQVVSDSKYDVQGNIEIESLSLTEDRE